MLEESLDPRPNLETAVAMLTGAGGIDFKRLPLHQLARYWDDEESVWVNVRNMQHWIALGR